MALIVVSNLASDDQASILRDLNAKAGARTATKYRNLFSRLYDLLAAHPGIGAPRPVLGRKIRINIVLPYIVIYRHSENDDIVTILRILHGRQNITRKAVGG